MWLSNARNNFAPFAGFMLVGFEKELSLQRMKERNGAADGERGAEATRGDIDDVWGRAYVR